MITTNIQKLLHNNINLFDKRNGRDYFICFSKGKKFSPEYAEISIRHYNYWHLLGCKMKPKRNNLLVYNNCKLCKDITQDIDICHDIKTIYEKERAFNQVFDFVENAKNIRIGYVQNTPEQFMLQMAVGNESGIIGYNYPKNKDTELLVPVSCQDKKISEVVSAQSKILFILSKKTEENEYTGLECEIRKEVANCVIKEIISESPNNPLFMRLKKYY